jgi:hypothetical protein
VRRLLRRSTRARNRHLRKREERLIIIINLISMSNKVAKIVNSSLYLDIRLRSMLGTSKDLTIDHNIQLSLSFLPLNTILDAL